MMPGTSIQKASEKITSGSSPTRLRPPCRQHRGGHHGQQHHHAVAVDGQALWLANRRQHPADDSADQQQDRHVAPGVGVEPLPPCQTSQHAHACHGPHGQQQPKPKHRIVGERARNVEERLGMSGSSSTGSSRQLSINRVFSIFTANAANVRPAIVSTGWSVSGSTRAT